MFVCLDPTININAPTIFLHMCMNGFRDGDADLGYLKVLPRSHFMEYKWRYQENVGYRTAAQFQESGSGTNNPLEPLYRVSAL